MRIFFGCSHSCGLPLPMRWPILLLLLLLNVFSSSLGKNVLFEKLCKSPFLDIPFGWSSGERYDESNAVCKQKYALVATEEQAALLCLSAMPYDVLETTTDGKEVVCSWTYSAECTGGDYLLQVYDKCYRTSSSSSCGLGDEMASPETNDQIRWISRALKLFGFDGEPLLVKPSKSLEGKKIGDRYYEKGATFANDGRERKLEWAMVVTPHRINGLRPGDLIKAMVDVTLCEKKRILRTGSSKVDVSPIIESVSLRTPNGRVFITRNDYQPRLLNDQQVDLSYFHEVCETICEDCIAATGDVLRMVGWRLPAGFYWVPVTRKSKTASKKCSGKLDPVSWADFKSLTAKHYANKAFPIPEHKEWYSQMFPENRCSDGDRYAVQFHRYGQNHGFVDVPVFVGRPILCYQGKLPPYIPGAKACFKNSEMVGDKCQCKKGFTDALAIPELRDIANTLGYKEKGKICVGEPRCDGKKQFPYDAFMFMGRGGVSMKGERFERILPLLKMFEPHVPKSVPVFLNQFSTKSGYCREWRCTGVRCNMLALKTPKALAECPQKELSVLEPGWTKEQFMDEAEAVFARWQGGGNNDDVYLKMAADWWIDYRKKKGLADRAKAVLIYVSDDEGDLEHYIHYAGRIGDGNIKLIPVQSGGAHSLAIRLYYLHFYVDNFLKDYFDMTKEGYEKLKDKMYGTLCRYDEEDIHLAI